jgi:hypothetical protein
VRKVPTKRLDSLVTAHGLALPDLAKIDTQGSELDVIAGARHALSQCAVVIVETSFLNYNRNAPMFADVVAAFDKLGFKCTDICEIHRARADIVFQLDLLFVNEPLYRRYYSAADLL